MFHKMRLVVLALWLVLMVGVSIPVLGAQTTDLPELVQEGPYKIGVRIVNLTDASRDDRKLEVTVWFPALKPEGSKPPYPPDLSGAPYPMIVYSHGYTGSPSENASAYLNRLVSQGYVLVGIQHNDTPEPWRSLVNRPLDILYLLDHLDELQGEALAGLIDGDRVGVTGYSFGGYTTVAMSGARVDPADFKSWCTTYSNEALANYCSLPPVWDQFQTYHDEHIAASDDDLWTATTDERIRAVMPIAPCFAHLFGEAGLAEVTIPTLIIAGTEDQSCPYDVDASFIDQSLKSANHYLVTLDKRDHGSLVQKDVIEYYATAFFGYYLLGKEEYADYLSPDSASAFRDATLVMTPKAE